jgi:hypothetical protein
VGWHVFSILHIQTQAKMKKTRVVMFGMLAMLASVTVWADVFSDIASAIRSGNAKEVSRWFGTSVDLKTDNKSGVYSKAQAEMVLKEFFQANTCKTFDIIHRGATTDKTAQYAIGTFVTPGGTYRTYMLIGNVGGQQVIQELSFEKE